MVLIPRNDYILPITDTINLNSLGNEDLTEGHKYSATIITKDIELNREVINYKGIVVDKQIINSRIGIYDQPEYYLDTPEGLINIVLSVPNRKVIIRYSL